MTAVSIQMQRGTDGFLLTDFTVGTAAPATQDFEVRYQLLDGNSVALTRKDIHNMISAVMRLIMQNGLQLPAGTFIQPGPGI
jgi:hypothetical protein